MIRIQLIHEGRVVKQISSRVHEGVVLEQVKRYQNPIDDIVILEGELSEDAKGILNHVAKRVIPAAMAAGVALGGSAHAQNRDFPGLDRSIGQHISDVFSPNYKEIQRQRNYERDTQRQEWNAEQNELRKARLQAAQERGRSEAGVTSQGNHKVYDQARSSADGKYYIMYGLDNSITRIPTKGTEFMQGDSQRLPHYISPSGAVYYVRHSHLNESINQGVAEGLSEARNSLFAFVKQQFPTWPDYVLKDFLYPQAKGIRNQAELEDFIKRNKQDYGNCTWTLTKLPITFDIFTPKTQEQLRKREGGSKNPNQVPRDAERHAQQSQMIQQKGVSAEPIIVAKLANGYDLIEGWHRTIQHLKAFPQGYTGPAWVCTGATYKSESVEQGVAEGAERAVDAKGRTQQQWLKLVKAKFPDARIMQSKMIDGPITAILADGRKLHWTAVEKIDEIIDPSTATAKFLRYIGRKFATAFPWLAVGGAGLGLSYAGLLAPLVTSLGGAANAIAALGTETLVGGAVAGTYAAPSIIQSIKDLFAADENSIQAGIKRWVEKYVGDEQDVQEFLSTHSKAAYEGKTGFRWRAKDWEVKLSKDDAEAWLEKNEKSWLDYEKQKAADAEKAKAEKEKEEAEKNKEPAVGESLNEFAPVGGDDREPNEEEILRKLAAHWWNGTEQQMAKAQRTLELMGWEIGQDESGDDDAGVFLIRAGDVNGDSYIAFNHSDLDLDEGMATPGTIPASGTNSGSRGAITSTGPTSSGGASALDNEDDTANADGTTNIDIDDQGMMSIGKPDQEVEEATELDSLQAILNKFPQDYDKFKAGGDIDENPDFFEALFGYYAGNGEMPYGVQKARDGDPYEWITNKLDDESDIGKAVDEEVEQISKAMAPVTEAQVRAKRLIKSVFGNK